MKYIMCSRHFPKGHPKAGQPTYFPEKVWRAFEHRGNKMTKEEVKAVLQYAIEKGYEHTGMLTDEEVDNVLKTINPKQ